MFGKNPKLKPEFGDGLTLKVVSIFETLQGEGPYSGFPAVFIRLSGCNLACPFCDTEFDDYSVYKIDKIISEVVEKGVIEGKKKLVVITGGEPLRQPIETLCEKLINLGFKVQLESNGILYRKIPKGVKIVCSPKNQGSGYQPIRDDILQHTIAIKFLISSVNSLYQDIKEVGQNTYKIPIYIQPMDEYDSVINSQNLKKAMEISKKTNSILSLQLHKILQIA